mmetsp:Transcript_4510/g.6752  ORF Transcript_4510/g.6752 Transcript_4510/m.6752 type:complete len:84 (+) Transcript_4510:188-439(+)
MQKVTHGISNLVHKLLLRVDFVVVAFLQLGREEIVNGKLAGISEAAFPGIEFEDVNLERNRTMIEKNMEEEQVKGEIKDDEFA